MAKRIDFYRIGNILQRLFATILKRVGKFRAHVLVHAAGEYAWTEAGSVETEWFDVLFNVNVPPTTNLSLAAAAVELTSRLTVLPEVRVRSPVVGVRAMVLVP